MTDKRQREVRERKNGNSKVKKGEEVWSEVSDLSQKMSQEECVDDFFDSISFGRKIQCL